MHVVKFQSQAKYNDLYELSIFPDIRLSINDIDVGSFFLFFPVNKNIVFTK